MAAMDKLSDPNLPPLPMHTRIKYVATPKMKRVAKLFVITTYQDNVFLGLFGLASQLHVWICPFQDFLTDDHTLPLLGGVRWPLVPQQRKMLSWQQEMLLHRGEKFGE